MSRSSIQVHDLEEILSGRFAQKQSDATITNLVLDSRSATFAEGDIFFAIPGEVHDGHDYVQQAFSKGIRNFVVEREVNLPSGNVIVVPNSLRALQQLAGHRRSMVDIPVIGITGSNGKTIVKEWLNTLLAQDFHIVRSPRSYNSQVGVPLSVWGVNDEHELAIFEAGISLPGEMAAHRSTVKPTIGVLTNVLSAHAQNFESSKQHISEKLSLFSDAEKLVLPEGELSDKAKNLGPDLFSWGESTSNFFQYTKVSSAEFSSVWLCQCKDQEQSISLPFSDQASVENAMSCMTAMAVLGFSLEEIADRIQRLRPMEMRLQMIEGNRGIRLINDAYSLDLDSLEIALNFLVRYRRNDRRVVILSDFKQSTLAPAELYSRVNGLLKSAEVDEVICVGEEIDAHLNFEGKSSAFNETEDLLNSDVLSNFHACDVLIKGARVFRFERIARKLAKKVHKTRMEIDLGALANNLSVYRQAIPTGTKIMCMVKAFAYGSGSEEIARFLEFNRIDYLGVAYLDEGVELREAGCSLPIMVMNPNVSDLPRFVEYNLEPEIYSPEMLRELVEEMKTTDLEQIEVHVKLDTGMHRLGFEEKHLQQLQKTLSENPTIQVASIFSHLAGSDEVEHDEFSRNQLQTFINWSKPMLEDENPPLRHIANSAAITRMPEAALEMVRLGIGLYGIAPDPNLSNKLEVVSSLVSAVSQVKQIKQGETIGYGRSYKADRDMEIATVAVGYADGLPRILGNGKGHLFVKGQRAPIVGNVCMDMTMIDVSGLGVKAGDSVEVFGKHQSVEDLAKAAQTIPYEIIASISERVTRVYIQE